MNEEQIKTHGITMLDLIEETSRVYVWRAVQTKLERSVFLVILKEEPSADPVATEYFLLIARQFAKIKCESLAAIFDIISEGNLHYVIMEHVDGSSLDEIIRDKGPLKYTQVLQVATSITGCLKQLWHNSSIIHRNLKGSTIRFDTRGIAKVMDFSLAIIDNPEFDPEIIDKGHVTGTPPFLSPEQVRGGRQLSTESDMYMLGALLYYISTGKAPFSELEAKDILAAHVSKTLPPPHTLNPDLPVSFSQLLHKLMMKEPQHRYRNWTELHHDLHCLMDGKKPICANVDILHLSTIVPDFTELEKQESQEPSFIIKTKKRNKHLAKIQDKHVIQHHEADQKSRQFRQRIIWCVALGSWFVIIFWFRAVIQHDPERREKLLKKSRGITSALEGLTTKKTEVFIQPIEIEPNAPPAAVLKPIEAETEENAEQPDPAPSLPLPAMLVNRLAQDFKRGDLNAAIATAADQSITFAGKDHLLETLKSIPQPDTVVAKHLKNNIGRPLVMNFKGQPRKVIPQSVSNGKVKLEANNRSVNVSIADLSAEQKSLWVDTPDTLQEYTVLCLLLLQTPQANQALIYAEHCGVLGPIIERAAAL